MSLKTSIIEEQVSLKEMESLLKEMARDPQVKQKIKSTPDLYAPLLVMAKRYICGEKREDGIARAKKFIDKGYSVSLECMGEDMTSAQECVEAKEEFCALIQQIGHHPSLDRSVVSFDLSQIGLLVDEQLAEQHLFEMVQLAQRNGSTLMISMENSATTDAILALYCKVAELFPEHIGITIQAQLKRTPTDLARLLQYPGKIRIVKGVYNEPASISFPRSDRLNEQFVQLIDQAVSAGHDVSIATHDDAILDQVLTRGYLKADHVEVEMLYGVRPTLLKALKDQGCRARVYLTYGTEWHLHVFHRLAEYPENIYKAIADIFRPARVEQLPY